MQTASRLKSSPDRDRRTQNVARASATRQEPNRATSDYYRSIEAGVRSLTENTAETRHAMYDVARRAMLTQLRALSPPLGETEITREQAALEVAIRQVEAETSVPVEDLGKSEPGAASRSVPWGLVVLAFALSLALTVVASNRAEVQNALSAGLQRLADGGPQVKAFLQRTMGRGNSSSVERPRAGTTATERAILYQEDGAASAGRGLTGTVVWRPDNPAGADGEREHVVRADIEIPEQHVGVRWSLRSNGDGMTASHVLEIAFALPPDFIHGGIARIPGVLMKPDESSPGTPLTGVGVKVGANIFLVNLSTDADAMQHNIQLLKEQSWFDIPIVFADGERAIMAIEKGISGEHVFSDAFAAWNQ